MAPYDAFISYSHAKDKPIAAALQAVIQTLGKPWYQRRALRIFRDDTSLSATPHLWPTIEQALGQSRFFVLLASPESASSKWVDDEVLYWIRNKGIDALLIAVTDGELSWDQSIGDFRRPAGVPLPPALSGAFPNEPKWVDLSAYRTDANPRNTAFTERSADLAAAIRGIPKEDLLSQELRQQRRALSLAWGAAGFLLLLAGVAGWQWQAAIAAERTATAQKVIAEQQRDRAERALGAANEAASGLITELATGTKDWMGIDQVFVTRILIRAQNVLMAAMAAGDSENSASMRRSLAIVYSEMTVSKLRQGDPDTAGPMIENAVNMFMKLHEGYPDNVSYKSDLLIVLRRQSDVFRAKKEPAKALQALEQSLSLARAFRQAEPSDYRWIVEIEKSLTLSAAAYQDLNDDDKAFQAMKDASEQLAEAAKHIQSEDIQKRLAASYMNLALFDKDESVGGSKVQSLLKAKSTFEQVQAASRDGTGNSEIKFFLIRTNKLLAELFDKAKSYEQAETYSRLAGQSAIELVRSDPQRDDWLSELAEILDLVGGLCVHQDDLKSAAGNYRQVVQIRQTLLERSPRDERRQLGLALAHYRLATSQFEPVVNFETAKKLLTPLIQNRRYSAAATQLSREIDQLLAAAKTSRQ
jgi:tetratricopeptide (TPR) repeat protein